MLPFEPNYSCIEFGNEFLLVVQYNIFECGRVAITMRLSHKIADGTSLATFVNAWASMSRGVSEGISPSFDADVHFSRRDTIGYKLTAILKDNLVAERFVFNKSSIDAPRFLFKGPSRVEVVSAFIWSRFIAMAQSKQGKKPKQFVAFHAVNLHERMLPQLPVHLFGNFYWKAIAQHHQLRLRKIMVFL